MRTGLPEDIVTFYDEAAVFKTSRSETRTVRLDLASLVQQSKVENAVVVLSDADNWYEPKRIPLRGTTISAEVEPNRDLLVALDLGEVARNNYQVLTQMMAAKGLISAELRPRICNQILCAVDTFQATRDPTACAGDPARNG